MSANQPQARRSVNGFSDHVHKPKRDPRVSREFGYLEELRGSTTSEHLCVHGEKESC